MIDFEEDVRSYVCAVVTECPREGITAVVRFGSGERHAVFKVSYLDVADGRHDVVVRISLSNNDADRARAQREAAVLQKVQGLAAPLLYDFRGESPWFDGPNPPFDTIASLRRHSGQANGEST